MASVDSYADAEDSRRLNDGRLSMGRTLTPPT